MASNVIVKRSLIRISTTVRLSVDDNDLIDQMIMMGFYPSKPRFVMEAMRDALIQLTTVVYQLQPEVNKRYETESEKQIAMKTTLRKLFLEDSGYSLRKKVKPVKQINLNFDNNFYSVFISTMDKMLGLNDLQEMSNFSIFIKLKELMQYVEKGLSCKVNIPGISIQCDPPNEEDVTDILKKSGLYNNG